MAKSNEPTDAQILSRLRRRSTPATAAELGTTSGRLRALEGVQVVGSKHTGQRGRPALLFAAVDPEALARTGELSEQAL